MTRKYVLKNPRPKRGPQKTRMSEADKKKRAKRYKDDTMNRVVRLHKTDCICPRCGDLHVMRTYHTGKELARKFCGLCSHIADEDYSDGQSLGY
jgi:ribosomal protein S27AE